MQHIYAPSIGDKVGDEVHAKLHELFDHLDKSINTDSLKQSLYEMAAKAVFDTTAAKLHDTVVLPTKSFFNEPEPVVE